MLDYNIGRKSNKTHLVAEDTATQRPFCLYLLLNSKDNVNDKFKR